jgi:hypothetical protein
VGGEKKMYGPETRRRGRRGPGNWSLGITILNRKVSKQLRLAVPKKTRPCDWSDGCFH